MLKVRLQRVGKRGQAYFRVVVVEHTKKPKGEVLELLGSYDPHKKVFNVKKDRVEYWMENGAQISPTVNNLMVNYKVWDKPKMESWRPKVKKGGKPEELKVQSSKPKEEKKTEEAKPQETEKTEAVEAKEEVAPAVE